MNIRKSITKIALTLTAVFWAGCDDDVASAKETDRTDVGDCKSDDASCGGMMAPLYGVGPIYDVSSSSVSSSDSCEQGCDEMISSSSESADEPASSDSEVLESSSSEEEYNNVVDSRNWLSGDPTEEIDLNSVRARGDSTCAEHGGLKTARQYEPEWGSAELWAGQAAKKDVQEETRALLESEEAANFSEAKKNCLEDFTSVITTVCMYGAPMTDNSYDIWSYICRDGEVFPDAQYAQKNKEYSDAYDAAYKSDVEAYRKKVADCDNATDSDVVIKPNF